MFAKACADVNKFTRPLISIGEKDGQIHCSIASFVVLNDDGWVLTAAHCVHGLPDILNLPPFPFIRSRPTWIWGDPKIQVQDWRILYSGDLAVIKLDDIASLAVSKFPTIKSPSNVQQGTSLCKLGFPLQKCEGTLNPERGVFETNRDWRSIPSFAIETIYSRNWTPEKAEHDGYHIRFLETSSPAIIGHSGGPLFDANGTLWSIQSHVVSYRLGLEYTENDFLSKLLGDSEGVEPKTDQYLHVGRGIHPEVIVTFLRNCDIVFNESGY